MKRNLISYIKLVIDGKRKEKLATNPIENDKSCYF